MAHCHPLVMVQSVYQVPDVQLASQPHSPEVLVVLAQIQQHPNSQQQGKIPVQSVLALVLTQDSICLGASMSIKAGQSLMACYSKLHQLPFGAQGQACVRCVQSCT